MASGLIALLLELAEPIGGVSARRMFGGWGLFRDGLMFALVVRDCTYIKADAESAALFDAEGLESFTYGTKNGSTRSLGYRRMPERCLDDADDFRIWASHGLAAAERAAARPPRRRTSR